MGFLRGSVVKNLPVRQEMHDNPLQYSCLENPVDRGAWWVTAHRVAQSRTRWKQVSTQAHTHIIMAEEKDKSRLDPR